MPAVSAVPIIEQLKTQKAVPVIFEWSLYMWFKDGTTEKEGVTQYPHTIVPVTVDPSGQFIPRPGCVVSPPTVIKEKLSYVYSDFGSWEHTDFFGFLNISMIAVDEAGSKLAVLTEWDFDLGTGDPMWAHDQPCPVYLGEGFGSNPNPNPTDHATVRAK